MIGDLSLKILDTIIKSPEKARDISLEEFLYIVEKSKEIFENEPYVLEINASLPNNKIVVIGDIHGNLESLLLIKKKIDELNAEKVLFLGDIVDRGPHQFECLCYVLSLKILEPERYFLIKGNHETLEMNQYYGFFEVLLSKFGEIDRFKPLLDLYETLSICAIVNKKVFCVHGGIPQDIEIIDKLRNIDKTTRIRDNKDVSFGVFQMIWNDPIQKRIIPHFTDNFRGEGIKRFGYKAFSDFINKYNFEFLIRSHEIYPPEGYRYYFNNRLLTIFSSKDYRGPFSPNPANIAVVEGTDVQLVIIN